MSDATIIAFIVCALLICVFTTYLVAFSQGRRLGTEKENERWLKKVYLDDIVEEIGNEAAKKIPLVLHRLNQGVGSFPVKANGIITKSSRISRDSHLAAIVRNNWEKHFPAKDLDDEATRFIEKIFNTCTPLYKRGKSSP